MPTKARRMKILLPLVSVAIAVTLYFSVGGPSDPRQVEVDSMERKAAIVDARIAMATSEQACFALAADEHGKAATTAMNYIGLKPDFQRIFAEGIDNGQPAPSDQDKVDLRTQFDALGHQGLVLLMCLRHLDDQGIVALDDSVPAAAQRIFSSGGPSGQTE